MTKDEFRELMDQLDKLEAIAKTNPFFTDIHMMILNTRHDLIQRFYERYFCLK